jgi:hypothetical protein
MASKQTKVAQYNMLPGNYRLTQQWDTNTTYQEWLKFTTPSSRCTSIVVHLLVKMYNNRNSHSSSVGMQNVLLLWKTAWVFYKAKHSLSRWFKKFIQMKWTLVCIQTPAHKYLYSNLIHNFQTWKQLRYPCVGKPTN